MWRSERPVGVNSTTTRKKRAEKAGLLEPARRQTQRVYQPFNISNFSKHLSGKKENTDTSVGRIKCSLRALCSLTTKDQVLLKNMQQLRLLPLLQRTAEHQGTTSDTEQRASSTQMQAVLIFHEGTCTYARNNCLRGREVCSLPVIMLDLSQTPKHEYGTYEAESSTMTITTVHIPSCQ